MPLKALLFLVFSLVIATLLFVFQHEIAAIFQAGFSPSPDYGLTYYTDLVKVVAWEIVWLCIFLALTCFFFLVSSRFALEDVVRVVARPGNVHFVILILVASFAASLYVSFDTFDKFPATSEEYAHLFQAEMFRDGKLWQRIHDLPAFFEQSNIVQHDGIEVSRFGPGWPLVLGMALDLGIPAFVVNPLLALLALTMFYFFARYLYGELVAVWSLLALAFTSLFLFNSSALFPHVLVLLLAIFFVAGAHLYDRSRRILFGLLMGVSIGMMAGVALYDAFLIFIVFAFYFAFRYKLQSIPVFVAIAVGAFPFLVLLGFYHYAITGEIFLTVNAWVSGDRPGGSGGFDVLQTLASIPEWLLVGMYWSSPGWLVLFAMLIVGKVKSREDRVSHPEDYILPVLLIGHLLYQDHGAGVYGPGFLFAGFAFLILFVVNKVLSMRRKWFTALLLASVVYALIKIPVLVSREERIVNERRDLYALVEDQNLHNAVVFISSSTSPRRPMRITELTRNDPGYLGDVIYAVALPEISEQLREYYPDRTFYMYTRRGDEPQGRLTRLN